MDRTTPVPPASSTGQRADPLAAADDRSGSAASDAVAGALAVGANARPILFVIDDLHWAAKPTLLMLRHVATSTDPAPLLIVCTYRDTDVHRAQPLAEALADLRRLDHVERIALSGLDGPEVVELLARVAGHDRLVSVVALGGLIARRPFVDAESVRQALVELVGRHHPELLDADLAAFDGGLAHGAETVVLTPAS